MEEELEQRRQQSLHFCNQLIEELTFNKEEADSFLSGDIYRAYVKATESAINKARRMQNKIRNL